MTNRLLICLLTVSSLITCCLQVQGQQKISRQGRFQTDIGKSCAPITINLTSLFPFTGTVEYQIDGSRSTSTSYTFNTPGDVEIIQIGGTVTGELRDTIIIEVEEALEPVFSVINCTNQSAAIEITDTFYDRFAVFSSPTDTEADTVLATDPSLIFDYSGLSGSQEVRVVGLFDNAVNNCGEARRAFTPINNLVPASLQGLRVDLIDASNGTITINYTTSPNVSYRLERAPNSASTGFVRIADVSNTNSFTDTGIATDATSWCYRIVAIDACSGTAINSELICSPVLQVASDGPAQLVRWNRTPLGATGFNLFRDGQLVFAGTDTSYTDTDVICNQEYCYQVEVQLSNGLRAQSGENCRISTGTAFTPPVDFLTLSVNGDELDMSWQVSNDAIASFEVYRRRAGELLSILDSTNIPSFISNNPGGACYQIGYRDLCGNFEDPGIEACPLNLMITERAPASVNFNWNSYTGWTDGVAGYVVEKYDAEGNLLSENRTGLNTGLRDELLVDGVQIARYRVRAVSNRDETIVAYSNFVTIDQDGQVLIPEAFTPNDDGRNDFLVIFTLFVQEYELNIYNRWGEQVFNTSSERTNQFWDGTSLKGPLPGGTYSYSVHFTDQQGRAFTRQGAVRLIR